MSELAKSARAAMKSKATRMAGAGPGMDKSKSIDASGWQEPTNMNANLKVGARPVSRQDRKHGGHVGGEAAPKRADRKARASGGRGVVDDFVNRNVKTANEKEFGKPHEGGWASGGATNFRHRMTHPDADADKRLIKHMVKPKALRTAKRDGGGKWIERAHKAVGGSGQDDYGVGRFTPTPEARRNLRMDAATYGYGGGSSEKDNTDPANRRHGGRSKRASGGAANDPAGMRPKGGRIAKKHGGKTKGKTNIIIGIHAGQPQQQPVPMGGAKPPMPQAPPPAAPPQGMAGMPPGMPMPQPGMQGAPQFPRKSGGRAMRKEGGPVIGAKYKAADPDKAEKVKRQDQRVGSGAIGRLEKRAIAQRTFVRPV